MQQVEITLSSGTLGLISLVLTLIVSTLAIVSHFRQRRMFFREEGKAIEQIDALKTKVAELTAWKTIMEAKNHALDLAIGRIEENLKYIKESMVLLRDDARCRQEQGK